MSFVRFCLGIAFSVGVCTAMADGSSWQARSLPATANVRYGQHYLLALPEGYDADPTRRWPLVVFLHGAGERGGDLARVKAQGLPAYVEAGHRLAAIVIAPQVPPEQLWHPLFVDAVMKEVGLF